VDKYVPVLSKLLVGDQLPTTSWGGCDVTHAKFLFGHISYKHVNTRVVVGGAGRNSRQLGCTRKGRSSVELKVFVLGVTCGGVASDSTLGSSRELVAVGRATNVEFLATSKSEAAVASLEGTQNRETSVLVVFGDKAGLVGGNIGHGHELPACTR
jgi:hypothetical protein